MAKKKLKRHTKKRGATVKFYAPAVEAALRDMRPRFEKAIQDALNAEAQKYLGKPKRKRKSAGTRP